MTAPSREEAVQIALDYLGHKYLGQLTITEPLPQDVILYNPDRYLDCWVVRVPVNLAENTEHRTGPGRVENS